MGCRYGTAESREVSPREYKTLAQENGSRPGTEKIKDLAEKSSVNVPP